MLAAVGGCGRLNFASSTDAAGSDGGDAAALACIPLSIVDDFSNPTESSEWSPYVDSGVTQMRTSGRLVVTLAANMGGSRYSGYVSAANYDMREHCIYITCVSPPSQAGNTEVKLALKSPATDYGAFSLANNHIEAFTVLSGVTTSLSQVPYDPTSPLVMRLRETGGMLSFEYSTDGVMFTTQIVIPDPMPMDLVAPLFDAGTFASTANPGIAVFDNFNLP